MRASYSKAVPAAPEDGECFDIADARLKCMRSRQERISDAYRYGVHGGQGRSPTELISVAGLSLWVVAVGIVLVVLGAIFGGGR